MLPRLLQKKEEKKQYSTVFEGYEGMKAVYDEMVDYCHTHKEDFIGFSIVDEEYEKEIVMNFFRRYDRIRAEKKIKTRLLAPFRLKYLKKYNTIHMKFKFIDFNMPTGLIMWGDNVAYLSWSEKPVAFVIHSEDIAKSNKKFFEEMWRIAKN